MVPLRKSIKVLYSKAQTSPIPSFKPTLNNQPVAGELERDVVLLCLDLHSRSRKRLFDATGLGLRL